MTLLKKLEQILKIAGVVTGFIPLIEPALPQSAQKQIGTVTDKLQQAMAVIVTTGQTLGASGLQVSGPDKLKAATPFVAQLIQQTDLLIGKHPKDEAKFSAGCTQLTSALADILNSFE